ncbi:endonuclease domain-containing protein [Maribacter algicola]|uniref:Endonuclease domain-containing protein n=1 Tax=Meishania litoralis TaxID=3434685 RepID=A0ACC7LK78_9FLAO
MGNKILPYNPKLKEYARELRKNSTLSEVLLWQKIKKKAYGVEFHRQVPILDYIVDFYCHELMLAIEIVGCSHDFKYEYDTRRQGRLEKEGVRFLRFSDREVKQQMFSVLLKLEQTVVELRNSL